MPAAKRTVVDAHHPPAHFVGGNQLHQRRHRGKHRHHRSAHQHQHGITQRQRFRKRKSRNPRRPGRSASMSANRPLLPMLPMLRDRQRSANRSHSHQRKQVPIRFRTAMKNVFHEHRNIGPHRHAQKRSCRTPARSAPPSSPACETNLMPCFRLLNIDSVVLSGRNRVVIMDSEMIGARNESAFSPKHHFSPNFANACPASAGPNRYRHIELNRIQRNRVRHVLAIDQRRNQRLSTPARQKPAPSPETNDRHRICQTCTTPGRHQHGENPPRSPSACIATRAESCAARSGRPPLRRSARTERWECRRETDPAPARSAEWLSR